MPLYLRLRRLRSLASCGPISCFLSPPCLMTLSFLSALLLNALSLSAKSGFLCDSGTAGFFSVDFFFIRLGALLAGCITFCDVTLLQELAIEWPVNLLLSLGREPRPPLLESVDD